MLNLMLLIQIWKFVRTDIFYNKQPVMAIRIEAMPQPLTPSTVKFLSSGITNRNMGVKSKRKIFLDDIDYSKNFDKVMTNISQNTLVNITCRSLMQQVPSKKDVGWYT